MFDEDDNNDNKLLEGTSFERVPASDIYVYSEPAVYLGDRKLNYFSRTVITGFRGRLGNGRFYCHFRDQNEAVFISRVNIVNNPTIPYYQWSFECQPVQYECVTTDDYIPVKVSVSSNSCIPGTSYLSVMNRLLYQKPQEGVAVCTKQVYEWKSEFTMLEWFEIQKIQGVKQIS